MSKPNLPTAYHLVSLETVDSTNAEAIRRAKEGEEATPDGTLIWAKEQTDGRGRRGRTWFSPPGNLYCSLVLRPDVAIERAAEFSFIGALALYDTLGTIGDAGHQVHCKWPNDILLNDRKVAGLLLETESTGGVPDWIVLGFGVNVAVLPGDVEFPATSFRAEGWAASEVECLESFSRHFLKWTNTWLEEGFAPIRKNWLWRCYGKGEEIEVRLENETLSGVFEDLDESGALLLKTGDGIREITSGDVFFPSIGSGQ
ncbi:MAG: biotin--[acetyl-CoA-carboxylase] ligase [Rhodospirillales bacterium]|nr:biotin--[acetyl-CoA-carboxylase] ligase [Alphaproteobacteria bacterium]MBL6947862.1 biotin--[acetyl-CoA-carboxylase] ligase [Rhodospirillales bacterium]